MYTKNKNEKEVGKLIDIIKVELNIDVLSKTRTKPYPDARRILVKILMDRGWRITDLALMLKKNHATIIHYRKDMDFYLSYDSDLKRMYDKIIHHYKKENLEIYSMTNTELKKEAFTLRKENNVLNSKIDELKTEVEQYSKYKDIFKFLKNREGKFTNETIIQKLNVFLNGNNTTNIKS
mgnify:CR=1 FL=1